MKDKSDVAKVFENFYNFVRTQFNTPIKVLRSDNAKEYMSKTFKEFLDHKGIHHQTSCPYTPQQNGVAERKNRHLLEVTRALLIERNVPTIFWGDAILTAAYLINRMPSKILKYATPIQKLLELFPNCPLINSLPPKVFGCVVFVHKKEGNKFSARADKCIFLGYSSTQKGYKCYCPSSKKLIISRDTVFSEEEAYYPKLPIQGEYSDIEWLILEASNSNTSNPDDTSLSVPPNLIVSLDSLASQNQPNTLIPPQPEPNEHETYVEINSGLDEESRQEI